MAKIPKKLSVSKHKWELEVGEINGLTRKPKTYRRWDHVSRRSKRSLPMGHNRHESSFMIMNAELSAVKVSRSEP
jgi:hypothetical protein